jgi:hypothetical protein
MNVIDTGEKREVMRYMGNKGVFFVCVETKEKGKINDVWNKKTRKSKKTKLLFGKSEVWVT